MMHIRTRLIPLVALALMIPSSALARDKKKPLQKAMLENMQAVPCGAKERGLSGLGSVFASAGITAVNSNEKLCPQYLLRTDDTEYRIRPIDVKHAALLPVGEEGEFKIKKNKLLLRAGDRDRKMREYQVVSVQPLNTGQTMEGSTYGSSERPMTTKPHESVAGNVPGKTTYPQQ
jgi:hypothetical protein